MKLVGGLEANPTHEVTLQQLQVDALAAASLRERHRGGALRRALCATLHGDTEQTQPAGSPDLWGFHVTVRCVVVR